MSENNPRPLPPPENTDPKLSFVVICLNDDGLYTLAARRRWATREHALTYLGTIAFARRPVTVVGEWEDLPPIEGPWLTT